MTTDLATDIMVSLRHATAGPHTRLEQALGLLKGVPDRSRFIVFLERLYGFHSRLEPALLRQSACAAFFQPRQRLGLLESDLIALGCADSRLRALPHCAEAFGLVQSDAAATGIMYVLEGSTLGGHVINRSLAGLPWMPAEGLRSLDPHGAETGAQWRAFGAFARDMQARTGSEPILRGAETCFALLADWLRPAFRS